MGDPIQPVFWWRVLVLAASIVCISVLHFLAPESLVLWYNLFHHLYILPIVIAAIFFGWRGGLAAVGFSVACYSPYILMMTLTQKSSSGYLVSQSAEVFDFFLSGVVTGILADRERRQKKALEKTNFQLGAVYRELQNNFEQMKRSERLYALGQLSAGLAHEIRNPLAGIEGAAAIVRNNPDSISKRQECLEIILKECSRLNRLVTNFLEFAKPRSPLYQRVLLSPLLDSVIELASHAIGRKGIFIRKEIIPDSLLLPCDPEQIKQVILNLTINAIQAMPDGGEILLSGQARQGEIILRIKDQGLGVEAGMLDKIFDPFFTTKDNGTGMGLSVAHQIVSQHGGMLTAQRNEDSGMTFTVQLPLQPGNL